jgi:signal transduction histidine kinase
MAWAASRRITQPLVALTTAAEAIAQGDFQRRVTDPRRGSDELTRLAASFDHMTGVVEASQQALAGKVDEGLRVSRALEQANVKLQQATHDAEEARDAAELANRAKSDFLAVMSHELRTPLNAIGGYAEILDLGIYGPVTEQQRDAIGRIARSQQSLLTLINDVLNFAKLEAGGVQFTIRDVSIASAIATLEVLVAPQLRDRSMTYEVHGCDDAQLTVKADPEKLQQILLNLLSNAIKYTAEGGRIQVSCERGDGVVRIHIADTGIGIAPDRIAAIFEPFVQVGRALNRPHEGVGLGLAISRDLAKGMDGTLTVTSVPAEGSVFTLTLPAG